MLPLAVGLIAAGGAGTAYGLMKKPAQYNSPNYDDIDLARDNPLLYAELQKYEQIGNELEAQYNQRRTGPSNSEMRMFDDAQAQQNNQLQARGSLGGSTALLASRDLHDNFQNQVMQRAFQEQQQMLAQLSAQRAQQAQLYGNAQNSVMQNLSQQAMADYQGKMAQDQARNQFFSGLMGGGMGLMGSGMQANAVGKNTAALQQQQGAYQGVPQGPNPYQPAPMPSYQFGQYSPYGGR
jgi:hypothetical protein